MRIERKRPNGCVIVRLHHVAERVGDIQRLTQKPSQVTEELRIRGPPCPFGDKAQRLVN